MARVGSHAGSRSVLKQVAAVGRRPKVAVALVTGAGGGIGRAVALRLAEGGWQPRNASIALVLCGTRRDLGTAPSPWSALDATAAACSTRRLGLVEVRASRPHPLPHPTPTSLIGVPAPGAQRLLSDPPP